MIKILNTPHLAGTPLERGLLERAHSMHNELPQKNIAVIGLGYVGLPLALLADKKGYAVVGIDVDPKKVGDLKNHVSPFQDEEITNDLTDSSLEVTTDFSSVEGKQIVLICVPTPVHENNIPDLSYIESVCRSIGSYLEEGTLVILESTVNPGVCRTVVIPELEKSSGKKCGEHFSVAHCPERINPGDLKWSLESINRVVGASDEKGLEQAVSFYSSLLSADIKRMGSLREAEAVKVVENAFRDINIAFVNELAMSFSKLNIDVVNVIEGAATKPFAFMPHFPGCGVGGHCIPVDPYYLIQYAQKNGFDHKFLSLARSINNQMPQFVVDQTEQALKEKGKGLKGSVVALLGIAYKPDIDDDRESPSYEILESLQSRGVEVKVFDPYFPQKSTVSILEEALTGADAVVVATAHKEFRCLSVKDLTSASVGVVIDGRNCLAKDDFVGAGIVYRGVGR